MALHYNTVLIIAGSDSIGGAGIQADIKTCTAHGVYAMTAITAVTAQNTCGVNSFEPVGGRLLRGQLDAVLSDVTPDAVKVGMLPDSDSVNIVAEAIEHYGLTHVVVDPVIVSTSGDHLSSSGALEAMKERLFPLAEIITPNIPEAIAISGMEIATEEDCINVADCIIRQCGCNSVLVKGGHAQGVMLTDFLVNAANDDSGILRFTNPRIDTVNTHGTGCTLSSAIASNLSRGMELAEACSEAIEWLHSAIENGAGYSLGHGKGPVNHMFRIINQYSSR